MRFNQNQSQPRQALVEFNGYSCSVKGGPEVVIVEVEPIMPTAQHHIIAKRFRQGQFPWMSDLTIHNSPDQIRACTMLRIYLAEETVADLIPALVEPLISLIDHLAEANKLRRPYG